MRTRWRVESCGHLLQHDSSTHLYRTLLTYLLPDTDDYSKHSANVTSESAAMLARELSANSTVLLKNEGAVLPLTTSDKVAVIGLADQDNALTHGGGSGQVGPSS